MKTINKTRLRSVALAVLALLFLPLPSSGQELIRECKVKGDPAIVRALASDTWMVYYEEEFGGRICQGHRIGQYRQQYAPWRSDCTCQRLRDSRRHAVLKILPLWIIRSRHKAPIASTVR